MIISMLPSHIDEIYEIEKDSFSSAWARRTFDALADNPFAVCFVSVNENPQKDEVNGYIIMYHILSEGQILNIAVKKEYRRKQIANGMMTAALEYAESAGIEILTLEVRKSNIPAIELYKKFGFKPAGIRKKYYSLPTEDAILMTREITGVLRGR